ncbi:hypothetical protein A2U01_0088197, partial [Trifolium medium]|nr:hypothetical protein [Trifolium medium]
VGAGAQACSAGLNSACSRPGVGAGAQA